MIALASVPQSRVAGQARSSTSGCVPTFAPGVDYFPDKAVITDATNFSVDYHRSYKIVRTKRTEAGGPAEQYVLVQCGTPAPPLTGELAGAQIVTVPITSLFVFSTTHVALLVDLDRVDVLTGVARLDVVMSPEVQARIKSGRVAEFAKVGQVIDVERVVSSKPSLLMSGGVENATMSVIRSAGTPVVANTEWLEPTALARAEWLKYLALFLNEERKSEALYGAMKSRYRALSQQANAGTTSKPLVMTGRSSRGLFTIAGGRSYVAALIADAGGRYIWADNTAVGSAQVDLEAQIGRAANADVWINGGFTSLAAMLEDEPRYAEFKAFRQGQVWGYELHETATGGNDYWSRSVTHPDLLLADLVKIFHPAMLPNHRFEWYRQAAAH